MLPAHGEREFMLLFILGLFLLQSSLWTTWMSLTQRGPRCLGLKTSARITPKNLDPMCSSPSSISALRVTEVVSELLFFSVNVFKNALQSYLLPTPPRRDPACSSNPGWSPSGGGDDSVWQETAPSWARRTSASRRGDSVQVAREAPPGKIRHRPEEPEVELFQSLETYFNVEAFLRCWIHISSMTKSSKIFQANMAWFNERRRQHTLTHIWTLRIHHLTLFMLFVMFSKLKPIFTWRIS